MRSTPRLLATTTRYRPTVDGGHAARQCVRLVAAHGGAQDTAAILYGDWRRARYRFYDALFPLSVRDTALEAARTLDLLGCGARRRQPSGRILALRHHGGRITAFAGESDPHAEQRLDGTFHYGQPPLPPEQPALCQSGSGLQGAGGILPEFETGRASQRPDRGVAPHTPYDRLPDGPLGGRRVDTLRRAHARI